MKAGWPPTVALVLSRDSGAFTPLKSPPDQIRVLLARLAPEISIQVPGVIAEKPPKPLALTTLLTVGGVPRAAAFKVKFVL